MLFLIDCIENESNAYGIAHEDSRKCYANEPANDEGAGRIEDLFEVFSGSEESEVEQEDSELNCGNAEGVVDVVGVDHLRMTSSAWLMEVET